MKFSLVFKVTIPNTDYGRSKANREGEIL